MLAHQRFNNKQDIDDYDTTQDYLKNDIVKYNDSIWQAQRGIEGEEDHPNLIVLQCNSNTYCIRVD